PKQCQDEWITSMQTGRDYNDNNIWSTRTIGKQKYGSGISVNALPNNSWTIGDQIEREAMKRAEK
ncbi:unnamed protein product, partial [Nesidiocoris tenuis]